MGLMEDQRAFITGGGSGIGRATAHRMAAEGAAVAVADIDGAAAEQVASEVDGLAYQVDVADADALQSAVQDAAAKLDGLTTMYNNAGAGGMAYTHGYQPEEWDRLVRINLTGVWNGFRAAAPILLAGHGGSIVSTASISGTRPSAGEAPYSAAKAAIAALTACAALEYGPSVRVNAVSPGMIRTGLTAPLLDNFPDQVDTLVARTPLARIGQPAEIADVVVFLCSGMARFITGQNVVVDGGMTLHGAGVDGLLLAFVGPPGVER